MYFKKIKRGTVGNLAAMLLLGITEIASIYNCAGGTSLLTFAKGSGGKGTGDTRASNILQSQLISESPSDRENPDNNRNLLGNVKIIGMMEAPKGESKFEEHLFLVPRTHSIAEAAKSVYCMWEKTNCHFGRPFFRLFPVDSSGKVNTNVVIGACYKEENVPQNAILLFSDKKFRFYKKDTEKTKTEEKGIYIFMERANDNYLMPSQDRTLVYQLLKKNQQEGNFIYVNHNRKTEYNVKELRNNIKSKNEIDYDFYAPLERNNIQRIIDIPKVSCKEFYRVKEKNLNIRYRELGRQYNKTCNAFNKDFLNGLNNPESNILINIINSEENFISSEIKDIRTSILKLPNTSRTQSAKKIGYKILHLEKELSKLGHDMLESHCRVSDIKNLLENENNFQQQVSYLTCNDRVHFSKNKKTLSRGSIIGMAYVFPNNKRNRSPIAESLFVVPPTHSISNASVSAYCFWERTRPQIRKKLLRFFPVYSNGEVNTDVVIGACYNKENIPKDATILFSDEKFKFYKNSEKTEMEEKGIFIFMKESNNSYSMPMQGGTIVKQLIKKNEQQIGGVLINHNHNKAYDVNELLNNIESSEEIDYDFYKPLA